VADLKFLEGGVQVQTNYCNSTYCYIMPGKHFSIGQATLYRLPSNPLSVWTTEKFWTSMYLQTIKIISCKQQV